MISLLFLLMLQTTKTTPSPDSCGPGYHYSVKGSSGSFITCDPDVKPHHAHPVKRRTGGDRGDYQCSNGWTSSRPDMCPTIELLHPKAQPCHAHLVKRHKPAPPVATFTGGGSRDIGDDCPVKPDESGFLGELKPYQGQPITPDPEKSWYVTYNVDGLGYKCDEWKRKDGLVHSLIINQEYTQTCDNGKLGLLVPVEGVK